MAIDIVQMDSLEEIRVAVRKFAEERDWVQFHTPKNLLLALVGEVGELSSEIQWVSDSGIVELVESDRIADEIADIAIYLVRLADVMGVELPRAIARKIEINAKKYPVELSRGNSRKYDKLA